MKKKRSVHSAKRSQPATHLAGSPKRTVPESSSGSEKSALDPNRSSVWESEETAPNASGHLSGDLQGLSTLELADSESVEELAEEGQDLEGEIVQGIENAPAADQGDVRTHKAPETRTPRYRDRNRL